MFCMKVQIPCPNCFNVCPKYLMQLLLVTHLTHQKEPIFDEISCSACVSRKADYLSGCSLRSILKLRNTTAIQIVIMITQIGILYFSWTAHFYTTQINTLIIYLISSERNLITKQISPKKSMLLSAASFSKVLSWNKLCVCVHLCTF